MTSFSNFRSFLFFGCVASLSLATLQCSGTDSEPQELPASMGGAAGDRDTTSSGDGDGDGDGSGGGSSSGGSGSAICEAEGEIYCFGECLVPSTDEHCGACGHSCGAGSTCQQVGDAYACACPDGLLRCAAACIDPNSHPRYCGASGACSTPAEVGTDCGEGGECDGGICSCDDEHTECDGECVDTNTDPEHCGTSPDECGSPCKTNALCSGGACECPADTTDCSDGCFDTTSAVEACGGCGVACATENGEVCIESTCQCPPGWTLCGDTCRDLDSDPVACGACDTSCSGDTPACFGGACVSGPCAAEVTPACESATLYAASDCPEADEHFSGASLKCGGNVPNGQSQCYQFDSSDDFEQFRCWWSGRSMNVNGSSMPCNSAGDDYQPLPDVVAGGYCVHIPSSTTAGADTDGFAIGRF